VNRKKEIEAKENVQENRSPANDPLKWFGILVPSSLRQAQQTYSKAIELTLEMATLQSDLLHHISMKKDLEQALKKDSLD